MRKKAKSRSEVLADLRRAEILQAALKVFGKKGFTAARIQDVAEEAEIAKGTVYLYFKSKEEIYAEAVRHAMDQLDLVSASRLQGVEGFEDRLRVLISLRLEFWRKNRSLYRLLLTVGREAQHRKQTHAAIEQAASIYRRLMEEAARKREIPKVNFEFLSLAIVDMLRGANERQMDGMTENSPKKDTDQILGIVLGALGLKMAKTRRK